MAFTQAQIDALDAAIAANVLTVEYDGERVTYRSMDELLKARALMNPFNRQSYAKFTRE